MRTSKPAIESQAYAGSRRAGTIDLMKGGIVYPIALLASLALGACATKPLVPYSADTPPLVLAPAAQAGVQDKRARFREIYCAVLQARQARSRLPAVRRSTDTRRHRTGRHRQARRSRHVETAPGRGGGARHRLRLLRAVAGSTRHRRAACAPIRLRRDVMRSMRCRAPANNARQIRDAIMAPGTGAPRLVLIGYSKGAPDILEAVVTYPEIRSRVAAVVSAAGAVGGSALANDAEQYQADLLRHFPGATCGSATAAPSRACGRRSARRGSRRTRCRATSATTRS